MNQFTNVATANRLRTFCRVSGRDVGTGLVLVLLVLALLVSRRVPLVHGFSPAASAAAVLVCFTVCSWALGLFREPVTTLLLFLLGTLFGIVPGEALFGGFASPAWWLVFGGSITGIALRTYRSRAAPSAMSCSRCALYGYYIGVDRRPTPVALAFRHATSTTRTDIAARRPLYLTLADAYWVLGPGRQSGRTGMILGVAAASYMPPTSILPANIPNSVLMGAAQQLYGVKLNYGQYLLLHFPVLGALKAVLLVWLICRLYPDRIDFKPSSVEEPTRLSAREIALVGVLALSLVCYATDFWHGVSPAWVSLAAGVVCLLPQTKIVSTKDFAEQVQITPLLYVAGFLALGAVITASGLGQWAAQALIECARMQPGDPALNVRADSRAAARQSGSARDICLGLPAVLTPIAGQLADASGLPLYTVLMLQVPVFSTVFLPYQSPPMMIAMHMGGVSLRDGTRLCLTLAAVTLLILLPLDYFWWRLLGVLA